MNEQEIKHRGGNYLATNWMSRSMAATARRSIMQHHIQLLEKEVDFLRNQVKNKEEACATMKEVCSGVVTLTHELQKLAASFYTSRAILMDLSPAEKIVFDLIISNRGIKNKEIANRLNVAERTVKFHMKSILQKAGVRSRNAL